jgi:ribosome modulation factor
MQKLMAFEQGYAAFLKGLSAKQNPFDKDAAPFSRERWQMGWDKAQRVKMAAQV